VYDLNEWWKVEGCRPSGDSPSWRLQSCWDGVQWQKAGKDSAEEQNGQGTTLHPRKVCLAYKRCITFMVNYTFSVHLLFVGGYWAAMGEHGTA